ncbi:hypothetical protein CUS_5704 [Ruminococcus albus 8]|uniref:Uncharacterized protein n=2 Tax=Oscillospiraceae TaxID=216572 RepID=E9SGM8_RUMAL|nr:hypothetical protein CUS_5704 [Ruminococcus albus 8]
MTTVHKKIIIKAKIIKGGITMNFKLTVKRKLSVTEFGEPEIVKAAGADGVFEAQALPFAKTACNGFIRSWAEGTGVTLATQKDWAKNMKTKALEKQVSVRDNGVMLTYVFVLENL